MEQGGSKTIMCSVLFVDIIEYSKKSVAGQISLKDRFNRYLSDAISEVPLSDRIILDTGDGAAINFMGDVEDALKAAISLRAGIVSETPDLDPPLRVRIGINLGPVRLVRDLNGQPNIVGDGINVAQRVMGFARSGQILVSRSYYDGTARLSPEYAGMFDYQGSRTDKHVRAHEVYAIGYPGEKTTESMAADAMANQESRTRQMSGMIQTTWNNAAAKLDDLIGQSVLHFRQAGGRQRAIYLAVVATVSAGVLIVLISKQAWHHDTTIVPDGTDKLLMASVAPSASAPGNTAAQNSISSRPADIEHKNADKRLNAKTANARLQSEIGLPRPASQPKTKSGDNVNSSGSTHQVADNQPEQNSHAIPDRITASNNRAVADKKPAVTLEKTSQPSYISINCAEGTEVFIDNVAKGKVAAWPLNLKVYTGRHSVRVNHPKWGSAEKIVVTERDKTLQLKTDFCEK